MPHTLTAHMPRARIPHTHEHAKLTSLHVPLSGGSFLQCSEPHSLRRHKIVLGSARLQSVSSSLKRNTIRLRLGRAALELAGPTLCRRSTVWNQEPTLQVASPLRGVRGVEIVGWCALHTVALLHQATSVLCTTLPLHRPPPLQAAGACRPHPTRRKATHSTPQIGE